jgi:hypothetical protein
MDEPSRRAEMVPAVTVNDLAGGKETETTALGKLIESRGQAAPGEGSGIQRIPGHDESNF